MNMLSKYRFVFAIVLICFINCKAIYEVGSFTFNPLNGTFGIGGIKITPKKYSGKTYDVVGVGNSPEAAIKDCYFDAVRKYNTSPDTVVDTYLTVTKQFTNIRFIVHAKAIKK